MEEDSTEPRICMVINRDSCGFLSLLNITEDFSLFSQLCGKIIYLKKIIHLKYGRQMKILNTSKAVSFIEGPSPSYLALQPQIWAQGPPIAFSNNLLQRLPQWCLTCLRSYPPQGIPHPPGNGQARVCWPNVAPGQVQQASSSPDSPTSLSCVAVCLLPWSSPVPSPFTDISP